MTNFSIAGAIPYWRGAYKQFVRVWFRNANKQKLGYRDCTQSEAQQYVNGVAYTVALTK